MDTRDREAIDGLFQKLGEVESQAGPRDAEAERLISERLHRQPGAPYYMAQTIVMQELALQNQQARIDTLERAAKAQPEASEGGGFFSRTAGASSPKPTAQRTSVPGVGTRGPWGQPSPQPGAHSPMAAPEAGAQPGYAQPGFGARSGGMGGMGGGGFLAGAAQTAMGVAGGVVLGHALGSMLGGSGGLFGSDEAAAQTPAATETAASGDGGSGQDDVQDASDSSADDAGAGYQDATYDDPNADGGFGGDDGGFDDI
ncbi:hypothetical protein ASG43_06810 [Aureimonas sp. Leaf454]|uniref:DUF2076 domain-containing protein n=1 Tax=Aureimonas sp. Leaf454 TaxID=1736381 RepID=UPI0006FF4A75|nr:DUF2076 domain-containing protein [Aureimonas sp. Leaf454]KQT50952.1 hypothetical protein ASG43_06810 [Aureimonas sp. Leaf454]